MTRCVCIQLRVSDREELWKGLIDQVVGGLPQLREEASEVSQATGLCSFLVKTTSKALALMPFEENKNNLGEDTDKALIVF